MQSQRLPKTSYQLENVLCWITLYSRKPMFFFANLQSSCMFVLFLVFDAFLENLDCRMSQLSMYVDITSQLFTIVLLRPLNASSGAAFFQLYVLLTSHQVDTFFFQIFISAGFLEILKSVKVYLPEKLLPLNFVTLQNVCTS